MHGVTMRFITMFVFLLISGTSLCVCTKSSNVFGLRSFHSSNLLYDIGYAIYFSNILHVIPEYTVKLISQNFQDSTSLKIQAKKSNEALVRTFKAIRHHMPEK